jgi:DNA helicase-2/ATP-dependent DNA helicase PcrA
MQNKPVSVTKGGKPVDIPGLNINTEAVMKKEDYNIGDRVMHKKYGEGYIKDLYDDNGMDIVEVNFDMAGIKRLVMEFAKLVKV